MTIDHLGSFAVDKNKNNSRAVNCTLHPCPSPLQICCRGFGHIIKYLEYVAKRGSDPLLLSMNHRDESLRRRKDRVNKRNSAGSRASTMSTTSSMYNGYVVW